MTPFDKLAPLWVESLATDLGLTLDQAAGIVGNLGFESDGFTELHEIGQPEGRGGYGVGQWTGDRRVLFLGYCQAKGLDWRSDEANYGYLLHELQTSYSHTVDALRHTAWLEDAVFSVGQTYKRPGGTTRTHLPGYDERLSYAKRAWAGASGFTQPATIPSARDLQAALIALGYYHGRIDGDWGKLSSDALSAYFKGKVSA